MVRDLYCPVPSFEFLVAAFGEGERSIEIAV